MEFRPGRLPMTAAEHRAVDRLIARYGHGTLTRRDPGESGPLLMLIGDGVWQVGRDGRTRKLKAGG